MQACNFLKEFTSLPTWLKIGRKVATWICFELATTMKEASALGLLYTVNTNQNQKDPNSFHKI